MRTGQPNPLVSGDETDAEVLDLLPTVIDAYTENPAHWGRVSRYFTNKNKIDIPEGEDT